MRFAPAAVALSLAFATSASIATAEQRDPSPRAAILIAEGRSALAQGDTQGAIDAFEAAQAVDPGYTPVLLELARAARQEGLQGKALRYYRETLERDPGNLAAISGEGEALVEKGAVEKALRNLTQLESLCGSDCPETLALQSSIAAGPPERLAVEAVEDEPQSN